MRIPALVTDTVTLTDSHAICDYLNAEFGNFRLLAREGKTRWQALATMALKRIEPLPDLLTVAESGYPDFETDVWFGLVAPAKTPKETITQLIDWFSAALLAPEVKSKLTAQALYPNPKCGAEFEAHIARQSDLYTRLIGELNIKPE